MQAKIVPITKNHWYNNRTLKMVLIFFFVVAVSILLSFNQEKKYKVELPIERWQKYFSGLEDIKIILKNSDVPSRTVNLYVDSVLSPMTREMAAQLNQQLSDTTKKK